MRRMRGAQRLPHHFIRSPIVTRIVEDGVMVKMFLYFVDTFPCILDYHNPAAKVRLDREDREYETHHLVHELPRDG